MQDLPIQIIEGKVSHEIVNEPEVREFSVLAMSNKRVLAEIKHDRVFLFPMDTMVLLQMSVLGLLTLVNALLLVFNVFTVIDVLWIQAGILLSYLIFVHPKPKYRKIIVPEQWTNYFRNKIRDDPKTETRKLKHAITLQAWNGVKEVQVTRPVLELSKSTSVDIRNHFKQEAEQAFTDHRNSMAAEGVETSENYLKSQKEQSDPYNISK